MISLTKDKELKGYKSLTVYPEVAHFVTTRHGGVSEGTYGSFNCSPYTKDSCINVNCNQNKLFRSKSMVVRVWSLTNRSLRSH